MSTSSSKRELPCGEVDVFFVHVVVDDEVREHIFDKLHGWLFLKILSVYTGKSQDLVQLTLMLWTTCTLDKHVNIDCLSHLHTGLDDILLALVSDFLDRRSLQIIGMKSDLQLFHTHVKDRAVSNALIEI